MRHMLSAILAKVTNIEKLVAPTIHNLRQRNTGFKWRTPTYQDVRQDTFKTTQ